MSDGRGPSPDAVERVAPSGGRQRYVAPAKGLVAQGSVTCEGRDFEELAVQALSAGHTLRFRARGSSMYPLVRDGDTLDVRPLGDGEIAVGEIILYRSPSKGIVVHRVVSARRQGQETILAVKGDAASGPDPEVLGSQVLGKIVGVERRGRRITPDRRLWRYVSLLNPLLRRARGLVYLLLGRARQGVGRLLSGG